MANTEKFQEYIQSVLTKGQRNRYLKGCVNKAKYYELEENEALSYIREVWGPDFSKTDEGSFRKAWRETSVNSTYSEDSKKSTIDKLEDRIDSIVKNINNDQVQLNKELLLSKLENVKCKKMNISFTKTTKDLLYWFTEKEIIWLSKSFLHNSQNQFRDIHTYSQDDYKKNLGLFSYMCCNPFRSSAEKRNDNEVSTFRYMLIESDTLSLKEQLALFFDMINFGVPIKSIIHSGGKSLHCLIKLRNINSVEEFKEYAEKLFQLFESVIGETIDRACSNPSRLTRSPFGKYDKPGENEGNTQKVLYVDPSFEVKEDAYEKIKKYFQFKGLISKNQNIKKEEIATNELLYVVDRNIIYDIWQNHGKYYWRIKDFSGNFPYIDESFSSKAALIESAMQFIDNDFKDILKTPKDFKDLIINYKQNTFTPGLVKDLKVKKNTVNAFRCGFLSNIIDDEHIPSQLNNALEIFLDNIFGENQNERKWVLQWMRDYMHNFDKMVTAPVFWGIPGCGKSMLVEAFGRAIGNSISPKQTQVEESRFNSWIMNAVIILDEISCGSKKDGKAFGDYLKSLITQEYQTIEFKGRDIASEVRIPNCYLFTSNISDYIPPVFLEENDRRYTIIRNDDSRNLIELWTDDDFKNWNSGLYKKILMKYIYNLEEDKSVDIRKGLPTKYKNEILEMSKNNNQIAAEEFYKDHKGTGFISISELREKVKDYGVEYSISFGKILRKLGAVHKTKCVTIPNFGKKTYKGLEL